MSVRDNKLHITNSLTKKKELFTPINEGFVGMYVCGPTVYSDVHLGNCRTFVSFDIMYRYLLHLGYKVRYVRNITDVGHLLDNGEDRMSKGAKAEQLEPMEVAQKYSNGFHDMMRIFNTIPPSIEPRATGHIIEQIEMVESILANGYAYEANGSVYFDTLAYAKEHNYGELSGRIIDDLLSETRSDLKNQSEKRHPSDFAIWMKASDDHIMKWNSPWSLGFPGWHLECSAMSTKYLGKTFDIHGGGNDLKFPHHENEVAQNVGSCGCKPANYWIHTNMLLMNGRKMSKSDGNTISPTELFTGDSPHVSKGYSPTVVRFFMLQCHYGSTLDITDQALAAAEKGYNRIMEAYQTLTKLQTTSAGAKHDEEINVLINAAYANMDDDFNTPKALSNLFELVPIINKLNDGSYDINQVSTEILANLKESMQALLFDVFGLQPNGDQTGQSSDALAGAMSLILDIRKSAREQKDWAMSDKIRDQLAEHNIAIKDGKDGATWSVNQ